jgi:hypothetical protein
MTRPTVSALVLLALTIPMSGCGASNTSTADSHTPPKTKTTTTQQTASSSALEDAVRRALDANGHLSAYVLWSDKIPSWASQSTRGPALAGLRASAESRGKQALRVRSLSNKFQVLAVNLDPSYTSATATVHDHELVTLYQHGHRGRTVTLDEHDRIVLRRLGQTARFVVWEVRPQK